jgi:hypothetical protein
MGVQRHFTTALSGHGGLRYLERVGQPLGLLQHGVSEGELMLPGAGGSHSGGGH